MVTHSPTVAAALVDHPASRSTSWAGGCSSTPPSPAARPPPEAAQDLQADVFLLGVTGVHPHVGLTTGDPDEAAMKRTLAGRPADTHVLVSSSKKAGTALPFTVLPLTSVSGVITDAPTTNPSCSGSSGAGTTIVSPTTSR